MASGLVSGFYLAQIAILNANGYPMGTLITPDSPVNGTVYSPYVIPSVVRYTEATPTYVESSSYAGMKRRGRRSHGVSDYGIGSFELAERDDTFDALVMESLIDTTLASGIRIAAPNSGRVQSRRFALWLTGGLTDENSTPNFITFALGNVYFNKRGAGLSQDGGQNPNNRSYDIVVNSLTRTPLGQLYSASALGVDGNSDTQIELPASYPFTFATYVDNAILTSVTLPYAPASSENAGVTNIFTKNGVTNHVGVTGITGAILTVTPGTAGDIWVIATPSSAVL